MSIFVFDAIFCRAVPWNGHSDYMERPLVSKPTFCYSAERPWGRHFVGPFHGTATKKPRSLSVASWISRKSKHNVLFHYNFAVNTVPALPASTTLPITPSFLPVTLKLESAMTLRLADAAALNSESDVPSVPFEAYV